jgi:hypothetical protein
MSHGRGISSQLTLIVDQAGLVRRQRKCASMAYSRIIDRKESHVPKEDIPPMKVKEMCAFMAKCPSE